MPEAVAGCEVMVAQPHGNKISANIEYFVRNSSDVTKGTYMKFPIRHTKTTATKAASLKNSAPETQEPNAPIPKLAVADMPYNASDKRAINKNNAPKKSSGQKADIKKKQAAAQES